MRPDGRYFMHIRTGIHTAVYAHRYPGLGSADPRLNTVNHHRPDDVPTISAHVSGR